MKNAKLSFLDHSLVFPSSNYLKPTLDKIRRTNTCISIILFFFTAVGNSWSLSVTNKWHLSKTHFKNHNLVLLACCKTNQLKALLVAFVAQKATAVTLKRLNELKKTIFNRVS